MADVLSEATTQRNAHHSGAVMAMLLITSTAYLTPGIHTHAHTHTNTEREREKERCLLYCDLMSSEYVLNILVIPGTM